MLFRSDRKSTRLNSSHLVISYAVFCLKKKKKHNAVPFSSEAHPSELQSPRNRAGVISSSLCPYLWMRVGNAAALSICSFFFFNDTATTEIYTLSLHDALPIWSSANYLTVIYHRDIGFPSAPT